MSWWLRLPALEAAFLLLRWLWQWFWRGGWKAFPSQSREGTVPPARHGVIKRDPVCGTYVDIEVSLPESVSGETLHFCSARCRDAYRARQVLEVPKAG